MRKKLLIADDEDVIRNGIAKHIQLHTDRFDKIYPASSGREAIGTIFREKPEAEKEAGEKNQLVERAKEYMAENYFENLTLNNVARKIGITPGYLSALFSQKGDKGFVNYLNELRIDHACTHLRQDDLKTYEIAHKVGFHDEKYFSKVFKKIMGQSPSEYRKANRNCEKCF